MPWSLGTKGRLVGANQKSSVVVDGFDGHVTLSARPTADEPRLHSVAAANYAISAR